VTAIIYRIFAFAIRNV